MKTRTSIRRRAYQVPPSSQKLKIPALFPRFGAHLEESKIGAFFAFLWILDCFQQGSSRNHETTCEISPSKGLDDSNLTLPAKSPGATKQFNIQDSNDVPMSDIEKNEESSETESSSSDDALGVMEK